MIGIDGTRQVWLRAALVILLLGLALALRLVGIEKESYREDEVASLYFSDHTVAEVLHDNAADVHPPLYYLGLHFWRLALGDSDARHRAYSTAWSLIGLWAIFLLARDAAGERAAWIALLLGAVHPLDVYFAQETRMYAQAAALGALSTWCLWRWMHAAARERAAPWWPWATAYAASAAATLYTHYLTIHILVAQGFFALAWFACTRRWKCLAGYAAATLAVAVAFLPWLAYVYAFRPTFYHPASGWLKAVPIVRYFEPMGFELMWGRVDHLSIAWWPKTLVLSLSLVALALWQAWRARPTDAARPDEAGAGAVAYLLWMMAGPVLLAAIVSAAYHPIFFRSRFAILVLPPFIVLAAVACATLRHRAAAAAAVVLLAAFLLNATIAEYRTLQKPDWRGFVETWQERQPRRTLLFFPPWSQLPLFHYLNDVIVSPTAAQFEREIPRLAGQEIWVCLPYGYDEIAFERLPGDYDFYQRVVTLGNAHALTLPNMFPLLAVTVDEPERRAACGLDQWFGPFDVPGRVEGFNDETCFSALEYEDSTSAGIFRWSGPKAWFGLPAATEAGTIVLNVQLPPPVPADYTPALKFYVRRDLDAASLFAGPPAATVDAFRPDAFEIRLPVPAGIGYPWIGWTGRVVNLRREGISADNRELVLRLNWIGVLNKKGGK